MKKVLDVGCGEQKALGAIGIDRVSLPGVDVVHDLNEYPWPFEDCEFDEVLLMNIIEHLPEPFRAVEEIHRILKVGGTLHIRTPYWNHRHATADPTHLHSFNELTWEFFTGHRRAYYTCARFEMVELRFNYDPLASKVFLNWKWLMRRLSYFMSNIIMSMDVSMRKR